MNELSGNGKEHKKTSISQPLEATAANNGEMRRGRDTQIDSYLCNSDPNLLSPEISKNWREEGKKF